MLQCGFERKLYPINAKHSEVQGRHAYPSIKEIGNPVDIIGDAQADRYHHAVKACLDDENVDGVLAILTPQAMTKPLESAQAMI